MLTLQCVFFGKNRPKLIALSHQQESQIDILNALFRFKSLPEVDVFVEQLRYAHFRLTE